MGLLRRKPDPIAESERVLKEKLAALEHQLRDLHQHLADQQEQPRLRSTAVAQPPSAAAVAHEPAFEDVNHGRVQGAPEPKTTQGHFNELGVRKYDPITNLKKWLAQWRGSPTVNPKLVNYLAAGSIHGLRPLRFEKRIARRRFFGLCAFFLAILWGLIYFYLRNR